MCDPITIGAMALSMGQSALQISSVNKTLESKADSVNSQLQQSYAESNYEHSQQAQKALDDGYKNEIARRDAMGKARVKGATLGIRGSTASELVSAEDQIGGHNVAVSMQERKDADATYTMSTQGSYAHADRQVKALQAQAPTPLESLLTIGAAGLQGYMLGHDVNTSLEGVPGIVE